MAKLMNIKQARILAFSVDFGFLLIHIGLLLLFKHYGITPMVYVNYFSIACYVLLPILIAKSNLRAFCILTYAEVVLHMALAVYFTGWNSGFQVTLIGMTILTSYSEYVGRYLKLPYLNAMPLSIMGMLAYIIMCIVDHHHVIAYPFPEYVAYILRLVWGIVTFSIMIFFLYTFVKLSVETEDYLVSEIDHDQLTGLPNRYKLWDYMNELDRGNLLDGHWVAIMDIDDFKHMNDTYGHNCGDEILSEFALVLTGSGHPWIISRWGGEEFLIIGKTGDSFDDRVLEMEDLLKRIEEHVFVADGQNISVTATVGMSEYGGTTVRDWIGDADLKLYEGKRHGKNKVIS